MVKNINLCGLGNGLIDLLAHVSDEDVARLQLRKGEMTLVDYNTQAKALEYLKDKKQSRCSGGSAANTIIAFTAFGGKSAYKTVLGADEFGDFYADEFGKLGVELFAGRVSDMPTGVCLVLVTPDSERTMLTFLGATETFNKSNINEEAIARSEWLYIEGYKFSQLHSAEAVFEAVDIAKANKTKVALTFSDAFITENFRDSLEKVVDKSDLLFCNENEAKSYAKRETPEEAFEELSRQCSNIAVTYGVLGSKILWNKERVDIPSVKAIAVDSTGAGDMYAAGFLYGISSKNAAEYAGKLASLAASKVVAQIGARLGVDHKTLLKEII